MRLKDVIKKIEKEQPARTIKIGTQRGSGFIFVGTIPEYWENYERLKQITKQFAEDAYYTAKIKYEEDEPEIVERAKERLDAYVVPNDREVCGKDHR